VRSLGEYDDEEVGGELEEKEQFGAILSVALTMNRRRLIITANKLVGLGPWNAREGDLVCILLGCRYPVVLRRTADGYTLVGEAYVDGCMNGEGVEGLKRGEFTLESFKIY
jgi:hypothetical protein